MKDVLLVDGYNVINAWPELVALQKESLEHARDRLTEMLVSYSAYKEYQSYLVFDAHEVRNSEGVAYDFGQLQVVFTKEGETADSFIEKLAYEMVRQERQVFVVTSDWVEQIVILWAGAYRISTREMHIDYIKAQKQMRDDFSSSEVLLARNELSARLSSDVFQKFNELRKSR